MATGLIIMLSRDKIRNILELWMEDWNRHDLDAVMELFHPDVVFQDWHGRRVRGKRNLRAVWRGWFKNHGGFRFDLREILVDEQGQQAVIRWRLHWPSREKGYEGLPEIREGLDILKFRNGLIELKLTYTRTVAEIDGRTVSFHPQIRKSRTV